MSGPDKQTKPRSGNVRHESGGRAIWEWAVDSGRHAIDSTSRLLQKLDLTSLRLLGDDEKAWEKKEGAGTQAPPTFGEPREEEDPLVGKKPGFNPYDTRTPTGRGLSHAPRPATPRPRITQPVRPAKKRGFFARLFGRGGK